MRTTFDIFEVLEGGSYRWCARVYGKYEKDRKMNELTENSDNQFCAIDLNAGETPFAVGNLTGSSGDEGEAR